MLGLRQRLDPFCAEVPALQRIPPSFPSAPVTHTELEKKKKSIFLNTVILGS